MQKSVSLVSKSPVGATCRPVRLLIAAVGPPERFVCGVVVVEVSFPQALLQAVVGLTRWPACPPARYFASGTESPLSTASLQPQLERAREPNRVSNARHATRLPTTALLLLTPILCNLRVCCQGSPEQSVGR